MFLHEHCNTTGQLRIRLYQVVNICNPHHVRITGFTVSRRMSLARNIAHMGERTVAHRVLVGKPEGKRRLGRPGWEDNIERYFKELS